MTSQKPRGFREWLDRLEVGMEVKIFSDCTPTPAIGTIVRATAASVWTSADTRFRRSDGKGIGMWDRDKNIAPRNGRADYDEEL